eukprot:CAMPEP_0170529410 /NCGR_PEP_ID=MMETSP0209-20121228/21494_1 /TAXON_ID=665100 ORGANISM="Litonotus pictus, Strain P1" /NCGR_SAMPLE_ID=MMETSP0209 /ASSEMBLY_ACC=CAM_ASM_000301 /LENGTH=129 /DNA_ID=CAMNT_0010821339 /DNA_START=1 /DNA_END=390 /DNA_ORIENTATION=+
MKLPIKLTLTIAFIFTIASSVLGQTCKSSLDCPNTVCCQNEECVDNDECQKNKTRVYVAVGCLGIFFIIASLIYMFWVINDSKKNVEQMREKADEEDKKEKKDNEELNQVISQSINKSNNADLVRPINE